VYGWEPARQYDAQPMGWGKVQDLAVTGTQLVSILPNKVMSKF
jgi:hypothetical protein